MISKKQIQALQLVYARRIEAASKDLRAAVEELNKALGVVQEHELTIDKLQQEISSINSRTVSNSITELVQREKLLYWLQYDLEERQFRMKNAQGSLKEKQAVHDHCKKNYLKAKQRLDFVESQKRNLSRQLVKKQEQTDEELFNELLMGQYNA